MQTMVKHENENEKIELIQGPILAISGKRFRAFFSVGLGFYFLPLLEANNQKFYEHPLRFVGPIKAPTFDDAISTMASINSPLGGVVDYSAVEFMEPK